MPVEIRELVIRATVAARADDVEIENRIEPGPPQVDEAAIVQECVRQVMRILRKKEER